MVSKNKIMVSKNCMETFSDLGSSLGDIRYNFRWKVHTKAYCILLAILVRFSVSFNNLRLEQLVRIFCALQTSRVLQISMNAQLTYEPFVL